MAIGISGMTLYTANDNEGGWSGTDGPDADNYSAEGTNSESWGIAKNATETGTLTKSGTLNSTRGLFVFWMATNVSNYYTSITYELESSTSNGKLFTVADTSDRAVDGAFRPFQLDYVNKGTETGTFVPGSLVTTIVVFDLSSSGNIRSIINTWIDAMWHGPGHTVSGTTVGDKLFGEIAAADDTAKNGVVENYTGTIFSSGDLSFTGTALTSDSETLVLVDTPNGYDTYEIDGTGTVTLTNTFITSSGAIDYNFDMSGMASVTISGGGLIGYLTADFASGNTVSSMLFQDGGTATIPNNPTGVTFNKCGQITLTGTLTDSIVNESTVAANIGAVTTADLAKVGNTSFTRGTNGHAVILTALGAGTMTWSGSLSGYATANGSVGDEAIYVNVGSGSLTINVASGASTPFIRTAGATVTVVSGATLTIEVSETGADVVVLEAGTNTVLASVDAQAGNDFDYAYSSGTSVDIGVIKQGFVVNYVYGFALSGSDAALLVTLREDRAYN